jgi:succinate-acetate transporter protein
MRGRGMTQDDTQRRVEDATRVVLRPMASPLPLAFFAFGVGSLMLSAAQLGVIPKQESRDLALVLGAFAFPPMLLAAVLAFFGRETLGATALGLISFSWLASAIVQFVVAPDPTSAALGVLYLALAVVLLCLGVIGLLGKPLLSAVILLAFFRYGLNGVYELTASGGVEVASGVIGCAIFLCSLYGGLALGLEDAQHRTVLPFGRRGEARRAVEGDLGEQAGPVDKEAGVRKQL